MTTSGSKCVPFINTTTDAQLATQFYKDCELVRLNLDSFDNLHPSIPVGCMRWIDAGTDGLGQAKPDNKWLDSFLNQFGSAVHLRDPQFQGKPDKGLVRKFVESILASCHERTPDWISVPQLPYETDATRNKINRSLAEETRNWRYESGGDSRFVLPIILTHQAQTNSKTVRNRKVQLAAECFARSGADGYWVVDHTLNDVEGSPLSKNGSLDSPHARRTRSQNWAKGQGPRSRTVLGFGFSPVGEGSHRVYGCWSRKRV